jgi:nickel-dependent lactate racemase
MTQHPPCKNPSGENVLGWGSADRGMQNEEVQSILSQTFARWDLSGRRVLVLLPDGTRTAPIPLFFDTLCQILYGKAARLDFMIALGTHRMMSPEALDRHLGITREERQKRYPNLSVFQHDWKETANLQTLGVIELGDLHTATNGILPRQVTATINRKALEYDLIMICGPVYPHEVIGYSGGGPYLFPGISGVEILDAIHMMEGLLTSSQVIGRKYTPARKLIDRAVALVPLDLLAVLPVVVPEGLPRPAGLVGLFSGDLTAAWSQAADLSSKVNVVYVDKPYQSVLSIVPKMYEDLWTGAKGMYKVEPAVADGGEVILYAPHISELSFAYGDILRQTGYHVIEYYTSQWERFKDYPIGVISHGPEVVGRGNYRNGVENRRVNLRLAAGISEQLCRQVSLEYLDPTSIDLARFAERDEEGILLVPKAGEILFQLASQRDLYEVPLEFPS